MVPPCYPDKNTLERSYRMKDFEDFKLHLTDEEKILLSKYQQMSDEELLEVIRQKAEELGRRPLKSEMELTWYLKERFGPWTRMLERAGLKPASKTHQRRRNTSRRKQWATRAKSAEAKNNPEEGSRYD